MASSLLWLSSSFLLLFLSGALATTDADADSTSEPIGRESRQFYAPSPLAALSSSPYNYFYNRPGGGAVYSALPGVHLNYPFNNYLHRATPPNPIPPYYSSPFEGSRQDGADDGADDDYQPVEQKSQDDEMSEEEEAQFRQFLQINWPDLSNVVQINWPSRPNRTNNFLSGLFNRPNRPNLFNRPTTTTTTTTARPPSGILANLNNGQRPIVAVLNAASEALNSTIGATAPVIGAAANLIGSGFQTVSQPVGSTLHALATQINNTFTPIGSQLANLINATPPSPLGAFSQLAAAINDSRPFNGVAGLTNQLNQLRPFGALIDVVSQLNDSRPIETGLNNLASQLVTTRPASGLVEFLQQLNASRPFANAGQNLQSLAQQLNVTRPLGGVSQQLSTVAGQINSTRPFAGLSNLATQLSEVGQQINESLPQWMRPGNLNRPFASGFTTLNTESGNTRPSWLRPGQFLSNNRPGSSFATAISSLFNGGRFGPYRRPEEPFYVTPRDDLNDNDNPSSNYFRQGVASPPSYPHHPFYYYPQSQGGQQQVEPHQWVPHLGYQRQTTTPNLVQLTNEFAQAGSNLMAGLMASFQENRRNASATSDASTGSDYDQNDATFVTSQLISSPVTRPLLSLFNNIMRQQWGASGGNYFNNRPSSSPLLANLINDPDRRPIYNLAFLRPNFRRNVYAADHHQDDDDDDEQLTSLEVESD